MTDIPTGLSDSDAQHVEELLETKPFDSINETQRSFLEQGGMDSRNTLLTAETGNGKTFCAEMILRKALYEGKNVAYLVPSVQLTYGKESSIRSCIDDDLFNITRSSTGDNAGYLQSDVIVATFDSYFEAAIRGVDTKIDVLIFDDFHELYGDYSGPMIEKCLTIASQRDKDIFATSATIGNPDEIARWLDAQLIQSRVPREVPIVEVVKETDSRSTGEYIAEEVINENPEQGPFMVFNYAKSWTESRARDIAAECDFPSPETDYREKITNAVDTGLTDVYKRLIKCLENGVGFHHSDLSNKVKNIVEKGVKTGEIKCISCTTTLAYGFDAPIQTVIVGDQSRQGNLVGVWEYIQWIGRAGRDAEELDEAYAYALDDSEATAEHFQYDTPVEEKSLEAIGSHFGAPDSLSNRGTEYTGDQSEFERNRQWLLIELVETDWHTYDGIIEFITKTLYGYYASNTVPEMGQGGAVNDLQKLKKTVSDELQNLQRDGFININSQNEITTTALGTASFEFYHKTRHKCYPWQVKKLVTQIQRDGEQTPEQVIQAIAEVFDYRCALNVETDDENEFDLFLSQNGLPNDEIGHTAGIVTWLWCEGIDMQTMEVALSADLSDLPSVTRSIEKVLWAYPELYRATDQTEPEWLTTFRKQIADGVTSKDLHLTSRNRIGRGRVVALDEQVLRTWDRIPSKENAIPASEPVIEKLAQQYRNNGSGFTRFVRGAEHIDTTADIVTEAVEDWIHGDGKTRPSPPINESGRQFLMDFRTDSGSVSRLDEILNRNDGDADSNGSNDGASTSESSETDETRNASLSEFV